MYGDIGRPVLLFEAYKDWAHQQNPLGLEEATSKADFPSFLYGPVRQSMWHGYQRVAPMWKRYARIENAPDFRERRLRGLNAMSGIGYVGDHGNYPMMRRTERPPAALVIDTYGGIYSITRQAIINDDSGELLNRNPEDMGYEAGQFVTQMVVALIESNPTAPDGAAMYISSAAGGRIANETTNALSEDSLATAISAMEGQKDDDGRPIVVTPKLLVVKNARMELIARRILGSGTAGTTITTAGAAGAGTDVFDKGTINPVQGILPADGVVRDPYFTDSNNWYLFADPDTVPGFAIGFLNGRTEPFVGLKDPGVRSALGGGQDPYSFEFDVVDFKVRLDVGVAPVDPRGVYRGVVSGA
jgi:hypothetical protein